MLAHGKVDGPGVLVVCPPVDLLGQGEDVPDGRDSGGRGAAGTSAAVSKSVTSRLSPTRLRTVDTGSNNGAVRSTVVRAASADIRPVTSARGSVVAPAGPRWLSPPARPAASPRCGAGASFSSHTATSFAVRLVSFHHRRRSRAAWSANPFFIPQVRRRFSGPDAIPGRLLRFA